MSWLPEQSAVWFVMGIWRDCFPYDVNKELRKDFMYPEKGFTELKPAVRPNGKK